MEEDKHQKKLEATRLWKTKNRKRCAENHKEWRRKNPEKWKAHLKKHYEKDKEHIKQYKHDWLQKQKSKPEYQEQKRNSAKKYKRSHPEVVFAQNKANREIKIPEGQLCVRCGTALATDKHHPDYSKPLEVQFACEKCHVILDEERKALNK